MGFSHVSIQANVCSSQKNKSDALHKLGASLGSWQHHCASPHIAVAWYSKLIVLMSNTLNNFQHWMPWLGWRWRVQQSVINMLNSRIPWINRDLNVHCAFRLLLKACLFQCLCIHAHMQHAAAAWIIACCGVSLCVRAICSSWHRQCIVLLVARWSLCLGVSASAAVWRRSNSCELVACQCCYQNMNLGQQARWI